MATLFSQTVVSHLEKRLKHIVDLEKITLRQATIQEKSIAVDLDYQLDKIEHVDLRREEKITKAILNDECFFILENDQVVGFVIFDYRFFDKGWIELIIIKKDYQGKGIGAKAFDLICSKCKSDKVFTSTNRSNSQMQRALEKAEFSFAGEIKGLDEGDPELFYFKKLNKYNINTKRLK